MLDLNVIFDPQSALQALVTGYSFDTERSIVQERCGEDATLVIGSRAIAIVDHVMYGTAPGTIKTELEPVDIACGDDPLRSILAFNVRFKPVDEDDFFSIAFLNLTRLPAGISFKDQVTALSTIHCAAVEGLISYSGDHTRWISLMEDLDESVISKLKG